MLSLRGGEITEIAGFLDPEVHRRSGLPEELPEAISDDARAGAMNWGGSVSASGRPHQRPVEREISRLNNAVEKVVVSDSITADQTAPWTDTTRIVRREDAHEQIAELKRGDGGDILIFGSRTLWNDLLAAELVDELHLMVGPLVLGAGRAAFEGEKVAPYS